MAPNTSSGISTYRKSAHPSLSLVIPNTSSIISTYRKSTHLLLLVLLTGLVSCRHSDNFNNREYTNGVYKDFNLHREKTDKDKTPDSTLARNKTNVHLLEKLNVPTLPELKEMNIQNGYGDMNEVLHNEYPIIAAKMDSALAKQVAKDSSWKNDTLPECIQAAFATQAMLGVGTVGGLITIAAPDFIWVSFIAIIAAPVMLFASLIAAAIAMGKINRGELDARYRKWMRLWAVCLLVNLLLGSIVLIHFTAL